MFVFNQNNNNNGISRDYTVKANSINPKIKDCSMKREHRGIFNMPICPEEDNE